MKVRKLATAAAVSLALASGSAQALILGEIEMRSALNQPIDAEIGLSSVSAGELDGMLVKLASAEAFARAGIERSRVLTDLVFTVATGNNGQPVILIRSKKPIQEPFLNFLLDVDWRGGRLVREYTVLLDPPVFMTPSATVRDTSADTPTTIPLAQEDSVLTPLPIDRTGTGQQGENFDESTVELLGGDQEVGDDQISPNDLPLIADGSGVTVSDQLGELVELESLDDANPVTSSDAFNPDAVAVTPGTEIENVVNLSDPSVATGADIQSSFNPETGWNVEIMADNAEISDAVGGPATAIETVALLSEDSSVGGSADVDLTPSSPSSSSSAAATPGSQVTVNKNDTLWEIASANKLRGMSTQQMMLALLEANQQAFINGNINLVKAGAVLHIPSADSVRSISQTQALAEVSNQEQLWREYRDNLRGVRSNRTAVADAGGSSQADTDSEDTESTAAENVTSAAAQKILEQARSEVKEKLEAERLSAEQEKNTELKIVADNTSSDTVASATADETDSPDTDRLGSINLKLQLAREELAAARLESEELAEQSSELDTVTTNMDQLVTLQQSKLAKLQAQLEEAQKNEQLIEEQKLAELSAAADAAVSDVRQALDTVNGGAQSAATAGTEADVVPSGAADAVAANPDAELVELASLDDDTGATTTDHADAQAAARPELQNDGTSSLPVVPAAPEQGPWYQKLMNRNGAIIGGAAGLTLAGLILLLRRRKHDDDELLDEVEFVDEENDLTGATIDATDYTDQDFTDSLSHGSHTLDDSLAATELPDAEPAAAVAAVDDQTMNIQAGPMIGASVDGTISSDDTISEAEVYLAYGLHGQAEDLLTKAIERDPSNSDYHIKLLQTYHSQQNQSAFEDAAATYFRGFGGAASPEWEKIQGMGQDISPSNELFLANTDEVESVGKGNFEAPKLESDDFLSDDAQDVTSQLREFGSVGEQAAANISNVEFDNETLDQTGLETELLQSSEPDNTDLAAAELPAIEQSVTELASEKFEDNDLTSTIAQGDLEGLGEELNDGLDLDESSLMDQSLDPGFAFDENDLEATGDFSTITNELNREEAANEASSDKSALEDGIIEFDAPEVTKLDETAMLVDEVTDESIAQDLSMDLDQLSGDMELDSTEVLASGMNLTEDLEIPDLTTDADLTGDSTGSFGDVDEMDTMMDLAKAYIDMGDNDSASSALGEIVKSGNPEQKTEAENLLRKIS